MNKWLAQIAAYLLEAPGNCPKILLQYQLFGHQRFLAQIDIGGVPFSKVAKSIELLAATEVAPVVRRETKKF